MSRSLRSFLPLDQDPALATDVFRDDPQRWLPGARHVGPDRYELSVGPSAWSHAVLLTVGAPWQVGRTWWRSFCWEPTATASDAGVSRFLPRLDAELGLTCRPTGHATLVLDGRYDPPGGRFGEAVDAVALGRVATSTVDRLLREITGSLGAPAPIPG